MAQEKTVISALEVFNTISRIYWPLLKVKVRDSLQHEEILLPDTPYKLQISDISLDGTQVEILDFFSIATKSQNDVVVPTKVLTSKNPFLNWTPLDVSRWIGTLGWGDPWDKYESTFACSSISGLNLTTITLQELENMGIQTFNAKMILRARDKIAGLNEHPLTDEQSRWTRLNEFDLSGMVKSIQHVATEYKFQFPMETWSVQVLNEWINELANTNADPNWKKCIDIIFEHSIDGKQFKNINSNVLIQYGMKESYAIALIESRDEFLRQHIKSPDIDVKKFHKTQEQISNEVQNLHGNSIAYEIGIFKLATRVHGPLELRFKLLSSGELMPDCSVHVKNVDIITQLQIELDVVRNIVKISFLEKPKIKTDLDVKLKLGFTIPLLGEDIWLPTIAETVLAKRDEKNPIIIRIDETSS